MNGVAIIFNLGDNPLRVRQHNVSPIHLALLFTKSSNMCLHLTSQTYQEGSGYYLHLRRRKWKLKGSYTIHFLEETCDK